MTNSNKENILDYVSGDYTTTSPQKEEIYEKYTSTSMYAVFKDYLPVYEETPQLKIEGIIPSNENSPLGVMYGGYLDQDNNVSGIIVLIDDTFKPIHTFYEYDNGTKLRYIQCMEQAEDGTFYFIDDEAYYTTDTSQKRFVMVNNFTLPINNEYRLKFRTSYILKNTYLDFKCEKMFKDANSSHYIFFGSNALADQYAYLKIFGLKINVGSENEWTSYANQQHFMYGSAIATFDGENVRYRCVSSSRLGSSRVLTVFSKTYTGSPTSSSFATFFFHPFIDSYTLKNQAAFIDYDNVYFVQNNQHWGTRDVLEDKYIGLYKYSFTTSTMTLIYEKYLGQYDWCNKEEIYIQNHNNELYVQFNDNIIEADVTETLEADYYYQRLVNDKWSPIPIEVPEHALYKNKRRALFVKSNFNLLQIVMWDVNALSGGTLNIILEDYNQNNYNSSSYNDYNSMISNKARLEDSTGIVFARNLYNKTIYNNTTTSVVQIPNTYLNNVQVTSKILLSQTNSEIDHDTQPFTKNIYENVLLNFIDSILVVDEDTNTYYPTTANYINQNINVGTEANYNNTYIGKVRVNFAEGSEVIPIAWVENNGVKETGFTIEITSPLESIDFISNDEMFTYLTKTFENLQVGNTYTIRQKMRIE